jgi:hypothetical protein
MMLADDSVNPTINCFKILIPYTPDRLLANALPLARHEFEADRRLAAEMARKAVSRGRSRATESVWRNTWTTFLESLGIEDPYLHIFADKVPVLSVFTTRVRDGRSSGNPVRSGHVRDEILSQRRSPYWGPLTRA